jgi:hypothetical protein
MILFRTLIAAALVVFVTAKPAAYDPLAVGKKDISSVTFVVKDNGRNRVIPIRVYLSEEEKAAYPPFSRPPIRPHGCSRGRPPKANS